MEDIAIVGAGMSGLAAAWSLARDGHNPVIFEKSRGVSGRAASRSHGQARFDHGANFFRLDQPAVDRLVRVGLPTDDLVEIEGDVWTFDRSGSLVPGDPNQNAEPKYTYRQGISQLGKLLVETAGLDVRRQTRAAAINQLPGGWELRDDQNHALGTFEQVILTIPSPQCRDLIEAGSMNETLQSKLLAVLGGSSFHRQFSFVLGFDEALPRRQPFHALVSTDATHPVAWLSFEEDKPGHLPAGQGALVVQMSPAWTDEHIDVDREVLLENVVSEVAGLLGEDFRQPDWWDSQRWMMAHPVTAVNVEDLAEAASHGLFFAGDGMVGRGRVPLALESGLKAAETLQESLALGTG